jgi:uncharacterized membrane protein
MAKLVAKSKEKSTKNEVTPIGLAFGRENYMIILGGVVMLIIGYLLMTGGGSDDPNVFNAEELFSTRRITVAPIVLLLGFVVVLYGIMRKPRNNSDSLRNEHTA